MERRPISLQSALQALNNASSAVPRITAHPAAQDASEEGRNSLVTPSLRVHVNHSHRPESLGAALAILNKAEMQRTPCKARAVILQDSPQADKTHTHAISLKESVNTSTIFESIQTEEPSMSVENEVNITLSCDTESGDSHVLPPCPAFMRYNLKKLELVQRSDDTYAWSDGGHICCHGSNSSVPNTAQVDSRCALLSFFRGSFFCPVLSVIICPHHETTVPGEDIATHFTKHHEIEFRRTKVKMADVTHHIKQVFGISEHQTLHSIWERVSSMSFSAPIPGLSAPELCIRCPNCQKFFSGESCRPNARIHAHWIRDAECSTWRNKSAANLNLPPSRQYTIRLVQQPNKSGWRIPLVLDYRSDKQLLGAQSTVTHLPVDDERPEYLQDFGWITYVESLGSTNLALRRLITLPFDSMALAWPPNSEGRSVERGLQVLHTILRDYLVEANHLVNTCHESVRRAITAGTHARFRRLQKKVLTRYRGAAFRFFALVLRYKLWKRTGKANKLGSFRPKLTAGQLKDFDDLYAALRRGRDAEVSIIRHIIHRLLCSSFTMQLDPRLAVGSAFEQSLVLSMLAPEDGHYHLANHLTNFFSWIQRICFSTFFHTAWLNSPSEAKHAADDVEDSDDSNDERCDQSDLDIPDVEDIEDDDEELASFDNSESFQSEVLGDNNGDDSMEDIDVDLVDQDPEQSDPLLQVFYDHRMWTSNQVNQVSTPMNRIYSWWAVAKKVAMAEPSKIKINWSEGGQSFTLTWSRIQAKEIDLRLLKQRVLDEAETLKSSMAMLAHGVDFSTFQISQVVDDPDASLSLFDREPNKDLFGTYRDQVRNALKQHPLDSCRPYVYRSDGRIRRKGGQEFLRKSHTFLRQIMTHFYHTSGVPPRAWQTAQFLYRHHGQYHRNLRILRRSTVYLGNPKAKKRDQLVHNSFWTFPPHLGAMLLLYLGVFREIEIEILQELRIPTNIHRYYIFASMQGSQSDPSSYMYSPTAINKVLKDSSVLSLEAGALRHIFTAILDQHYPQLHQSVTSLVVTQGQHTNLVKEGHYARDEVQRSTGLSASTRYQQFAVSHALQAWYGFVAQNHDWTRGRGDFPQGDCHENISLALNVARHLILQGDYRLADGDPDSRASRVVEVIANKPFLTGNKVMAETGSAPWDTLGDDILVRVTATLKYGLTQPCPLSFPPLDGYDDYAACASVLITVAINEWKSGHLDPIRGVTHILPRINSETGHALKVIEQLKEQQPKAWGSFCIRVHEAQCSNNVDTLNVVAQSSSKD